MHARQNRNWGSVCATAVLRDTFFGLQSRLTKSLLRITRLVFDDETVSLLNVCIFVDTMCWWRFALILSFTARKSTEAKVEKFFYSLFLLLNEKYSSIPCFLCCKIVNLLVMVYQSIVWDSSRLCEMSTSTEKVCDCIFFCIHVFLWVWIKTHRHTEGTSSCFSSGPGFMSDMWSLAACYPNSLSSHVQAALSNTDIKKKNSS